MIDANDLRIGNWVDDSTGNYYQINRSDFENTNFNVTIPIPLTPEILEKCGFEKSNAHGWYKKRPTPSSQLMEIFKPDNAPFHYADGAFSPELKYLHQLQNLYWCLCSEELTINIPK